MPRILSLYQTLKGGAAKTSFATPPLSFRAFISLPYYKLCEQLDWMFV